MVTLQQVSHCRSIVRIWRNSNIDCAVRHRDPIPDRHARFRPTEAFCVYRVERGSAGRCAGTVMLA